MGQYATVHSTPTSRFYFLVYQDFLQRTRTSHKLPVLFPVLSVPVCLLVINYFRVHYMTLASLFSHGLCDAHFFVLAEVGHLINIHALTPGLRLRVRSETAPLRVCFVLCRTSTPTSCVNKGSTSTYFIFPLKALFKLKVTT